MDSVLEALHSYLTSPRRWWASDATRAKAREREAAARRAGLHVVHDGRVAVPKPRVR